MQKVFQTTEHLPYWLWSMYNLCAQPVWWKIHILAMKSWLQCLFFTLFTLIAQTHSSLHTTAKKKRAHTYHDTLISGGSALELVLESADSNT